MARCVGMWQYEWIAAVLFFLAGGSESGFAAERYLFQEGNEPAVEYQDGFTGLLPLELDEPGTSRLRASVVGRSGHAAVQWKTVTVKPRKPPSTAPLNFVVILIDDLGYGDIAPFGSALNRTPHLDRMAAEGMKLTAFYAAAPVCTPSRAALMTGCYPKRIGLASGSRHAVLFPGDPHGLHPDEITIAEILQEQGYVTGCFGKWHLGDQPGFLPNDQGFDAYYGIPYSNDMWPLHPNKKWSFPPLPLLHNRRIVGQVNTLEDQSKLCQQFTQAAVQFIHRHRETPFFVYLPHAFVHHPRSARPPFLQQTGIGSLDQAVKDPAQRQRALNQAQIEEVDWSVGQILQTLKELRLSAKTLVLFASDNGGARGNVNAPLRGGKGSPFEGGMRVPAIAWQPGIIPANSACDEPITAMDILPTFAKLANGQIPADRTIDGRDIAALLQGKPAAAPPVKAFYYYQQTRLRAVRSGPWKLFADGRLYHLKRDLGETVNLAGENPAIVARLNRLLEQARKDLGDGDRPGQNTRPPGLAPHSRTLLPRPGVQGKAARQPTLHSENSAEARAETIRRPNP